MTRNISTADLASAPAGKRPKLAAHHPLLPGLPDDIAQLCLSRVPSSLLFSVCRSWRRLIYSPSFPPFLSLYALVSPTCNDQTQFSDAIEYLSFDPISAEWQSLPPPPLRLQLRHPSFISWNMPVQTVAVSGNLVLLAATTDQFLPALTRPLVFSPISQKWVLGPPLGTPRRWCAAGAIREGVYVASGIGSVYSPEVARSVEKWDFKTNQSQRRNHEMSKIGSSRGWKWEKMGGLRDGRFSREAIDAVGWRGKLCMVNVKGKGAKEGLVYDVATNTAMDMPEGMLLGWRGPAAAMEEETIYGVDESNGALRKYDPGEDRWVEIMASERLKGAKVMTAGGGKVCVAGQWSEGIAVVEVMVEPPRLVVVDLPVGMEAVGIHILPRMSHHHPDFFGM